MRGWLYTEGHWSWGCAITWHIVDMNPDESHILEGRVEECLYYWVAYLWRWHPFDGWLHAPWLSTEADQLFVEAWMVHDDDVAVAWFFDG